MPLRRGKSKTVVSENISELHRGPTFRRTMNKFGKKRADKQAVAIALSEKRRSSRGIPKRDRHGYY